MDYYQIRFATTGTAPDKTMVEISANSPNEALRLAQMEAGTRPAELWCNGRKLARMRNKGTREQPSWLID